MFNYAKTAGLVAIGLVVMFGYMHYTSLLNELDNLKIKNKNLDLAYQSEREVNKQFKSAIVEWKDSNAEILETAKELRQVSIGANKEVRKLNDIFAKHDIEKLASRKPGLIETRLNNGTADAFRMLECSSGSTHKSCNGGNR